jgi:nucleoside-diphosphate-sugar epimerase
MNNQTKVLITGGSGFIGTNLIEFLVERKYDLVNLDLIKPRNIEHLRFWKKCDVLHFDELQEIFNEFSPNIVVHLAARTDLDGKKLSEYNVNFKGVENVVNATNSQKNITRLILTSSLLVCKLGHIPLTDVEFMPNTFYGESKVIAENIIRNNTADHYNWTILRPTSIWGPWFSKPYKDFFDLVLRGGYLHPNGVHPKRTYGYVANTVNQIYSIFNDDDSNEMVLYLGDSPPITVYEWAKGITHVTGANKPKKVPYFIVYLSSVAGSLIGKAFNFPINLSRLNNMSKAAVYDVSYLEGKAEQLNLSKISFENGIRQTVNWMKNNE